MTTYMPDSLVPVLADLPVSYRQFDYWVRRGLIHAPGYGSGRLREPLTDEEQRVLRHMAHLVADGVTPDRAAELARQLATTGCTVLGGHTITTIEEG